MKCIAILLLFVSITLASQVMGAIYNANNLMIEYTVIHPKDSNEVAHVYKNIYTGIFSIIHRFSSHSKNPNINIKSEIYILPDGAKLFFKEKDHILFQKDYNDLRDLLQNLPTTLEPLLGKPSQKNGRDTLPKMYSLRLKNKQCEIFQNDSIWDSDSYQGRFLWLFPTGDLILNPVATLGSYCELGFMESKKDLESAIAFIQAHSPGIKFEVKRRVLDWESIYRFYFQHNPHP